MSKGTDYLPDFLQTQDELLCQICEGRGDDRVSLRDSYRRISCSDLTVVEGDVDNYVNWVGMEDAEALSALRFLESMPRPSKFEKRTVSISYEFGREESRREAEALCEVLTRNGEFVENRHGWIFQLTVKRSE
jgi:hypothetical protein